MSRTPARTARTRRHLPNTRPWRTTGPTTVGVVRRLRSLIGGMTLVAALDVRSAARRRATWTALGVWVALVYGLLILALAGTSGGQTDDGAGALVHSLVASAALGGGLAVAPALGVTTLIHARDTGLLDMLRTTQLGARDISWGVFVAGFARLAALVALTAPALSVGFVLGGSDVSAFALSLVVLCVVPAAVAGVAQAFATVFARRATALAAAYTATGVLVLGPWLAYTIVLPLTSETVSTRVSVLAGTHGTTRTEDAPSCTTVTEDRERTRSDRIWWLLAPEPFVVLADAAPGRRGGAVSFEPLSALRDGIRAAKVAPPDPHHALADECPVARADPRAADTGSESGETSAAAGAGGAVQAPWRSEAALDRAVLEAVAPTWPLGLGMVAATGAAAIAVSTRRLRAPGAAAIGEHPTQRSSA